MNGTASLPRVGERYIRGENLYANPEKKWTYAFGNDNVSRIMEVARGGKDVVYKVLFSGVTCVASAEEFLAEWRLMP